VARRNDHSREELHRLILDAARAHVMEQGMEALNARAIATAIGYSPGTLYNVFENLDDIVVHLNAETMDLLYDALTETLPEAPEAALHHLANRYAQFAADNRPVWQMLFDYAFAEALVLPDWYLDRINRLFAVVDAPLHQLAAAAGEQAQRDLTFAFWSATHGSCTLLIGRRYHIFDAYDVQQVLRRTVETFVQGLRQGRH